MRRVFILLGIAVLLGIAGWFVAVYVEKAEFERRVAAIRAAGQPTTPEELVPEPIPDDENAAVLLAEAHAFLEELQEDNLGYALLGIVPEAEWSREDRASVVKYLADAKPYRDLVERAVALPGWRVEPDYGSDEFPFTVQPVVWTRHISEHFKWLVRMDSNPKGRTERAAQAATLLLRYAERARPMTIVGDLSLSSLRVHAVDGVRTSWRWPGFDAALYRSLLDEPLARAERPTGPPARLIEAERTSVCWVVDGWPSYAGEIDAYGAWNRLSLYRDANLALELYGRALAASDVPPEEALRFRLGASPDPAEQPIASWAKLSEHWFRSYTEEVAALRLARVALAVLEHRQQNGRWPERLPAEMPVDPFTNEPFQYRRLANGVHLESGAPRRDLAKHGLAWDLVE
jgi:hypothetical protein